MMTKHLQRQDLPDPEDLEDLQAPKHHLVLELVHLLAQNKVDPDHLSEAV